MNSEMMKKMMDKKKSKGDMSPVEKDAKMGVVQAMRDMASNAMNDKLKGLKKVSVASNSSEGLKHGLDKAKELLDAHESSEEPQAEDNEAMDSIDDHSEKAMDESEGGDSHGLEEQGDEGSEEEESAESPEEEASEEEPSSHESHMNDEADSMKAHHGLPEEMDEADINAKLEHLMKLKAKKAK